MTGNVTFAARIAVFEPRAAYLFVLFVDLKLVVGQVEPKGADQVDAADASTDADNTNGLRGTEWLFTDSVGRMCPVAVRV